MWQIKNKVHQVRESLLHTLSVVCPHIYVVTEKNDGLEKSADLSAHDSLMALKITSLHP